MLSKNQRKERKKLAPKSYQNVGQDVIVMETSTWLIVYHGVLLQVVTLVGEPFVFIKAMPNSGKCEDLDNPDKKRKHIKCSGKVYGEHAKLVAGDQNDHCCYGEIVN